ncbi:MAG: 1-phosphofructokinase family hexose kinase [Clostridia bacterium]|nr:1-phosphofructokinase family hexose kinase [Clostridia bacterium]
MITTVTMNPCIDRSIRIPKLNVGGYNRVSRVRTDIGGKGINVSVALHNMRYESRALCLDSMDSGTYLTDTLTSMGIFSVMVPVPGHLRENLKVYDETTGDMTEINEAGTPVDVSSLKRFMQRFQTILSDTNLLVLSGSVPPGVPDDIYRQMIEMAKSRGVITVLDAAGERLRLGIEAGPDLIKPNRFEMETLCGRELTSRQDAIDEAKRLTENGVGAVCLSLGAEGAVYVTQRGIWSSEGLKIDVKGLQGAGDALVAGLCIGRLEGMDPGETLRNGMTMAQGSLTREGTLLCTRMIYDELRPKMPVERLA